MSEVHMTTGVKGGVGKTLAAVVMAQYLIEERGLSPKCVDLDWKNRSFAKFKALDVLPLDLETNGDIEKRKFDVLIENIANSAEDDIFVIDCGSNTYAPLMNYMLKYNVAKMLLGMGQRLNFHIPISGGAELSETVATFVEVATGMPEEAPIVIWKNSYHGIIEQDGKTFEEFKAYKKHGDRVTSIVTIPHMLEDMRRDLSEMFKSKMLFKDATKEGFIMVRQRLSCAWELLKDALETAQVFP